MKFKIMKKLCMVVGMLVVCSMAGTLKDSRDGKTYKTVKIGKQVWMAENLNYKTKGSVCFDNKDENCKKYGRLYTLEAAKSACPSGWHLPSMEEFESLLYYMGPDNSEWSRNLRASSWDEGLDKYGFSALPAGRYDSESFDRLGNDANFWSSEGRSGYNSLIFSKSDFGARERPFDVVYFEYNDLEYGFSVRCLRY